MAPRTAAVVGTALATLALVVAFSGLSANGDETLNPAAEVVADLSPITDFTIRGDTDGCVFDADRGGLVYEDLRVTSRSTGVLELSFYIQRESLDDILPGYTSAVLTFDDESRSHTFDIVVPITQGEFDAGYDDCRWTTGGD